MHVVVQSLINDLINMLNKLDLLIISVKQHSKISLINGLLDVVQIIINMLHVLIASFTFKLHRASVAWLSAALLIW